ncbi:MAG: DUF3524 domain-containing protein [Planctomycetales bacterium]|nr:DUF3524 domain-containing protein [Planctomycetales bacterium]
MVSRPARELTGMTAEGDSGLRLRVLALEPYYGGSHRAFLDTWTAASRHEWTLLTLPAHHWKWRMRHAPVTLAEWACQRQRNGESWDVVFCSDMLSLADWRGLCRTSASGARGIGDLPTVAYFHENQLTYPVRRDEPRDLHFAFSNLTTMLAADEVWFNSEFHRDDLFAAAEKLLSRMPDYSPLVSLSHLRAKTRVEWPGCPAPVPRTGAASAGAEMRSEPLQIAWAARWDHDKGLPLLKAAVRELLADGLPFRMHVMGEVFREQPEGMAELRCELERAGCLGRWGFQSAEVYRDTLSRSDLFLSTADHEFFGLAVLEAIAAGVVPVLPRRLSYPELLAGAASPEAFFYAGDPKSLGRRLREHLEGRTNLAALRDSAQQAIGRFDWAKRIPALDESLLRLTRN